MNAVVQMTLRSCVVLFFSLVSNCLCAQSLPKEDLGAAISTSSAKEIVKLTGPVIELNLEGQKVTCKQAEALGRLRTFFQKYPVSSFEFVHEGKSPNGQIFLIGQYKTGQKKFRVHVLLEAHSSRYLVKVLSFY
ncbi:MAG: DUF4783 domain-containing protein [Cytophagales bacterium]|nr:DUF4783 domain-containing protein [Cytophagales bacterium]